MATVEGTQTSAQARPVLATIGLLALVLAGVIGADPYQVRERLIDRVAPSSETLTLPQDGWKGVVSLRGIGETKAAPFSIDRGALRWRVRWNCQSRGQMTVQEAGQPVPVIDALCPGSGVGFANQIGIQRLVVHTQGPWQLEVEEQLSGTGQPGAPT